ncbi:hypothetical protein GGR09_000878 [Bartonella heixiaziensis]
MRNKIHLKAKQTAFPPLIIAAAKKILTNTND